MTPPARAVEVPTRRVTAVIPCYNRRRDVELLLGDLERVRLRSAGTDLRVIVVDNASERPLSGLEAPGKLRVEHVRLEKNTGGSGGFNAGIARCLESGVPCDSCGFIWLLDSDARVDAGALEALLVAMDADEELVAVGSSLADPETGEVFEMGGHVDRTHGEYVQPAPARGDRVRRVEYVAACSLLVRRWAVERAGPMADLFVSGDDVEWCLRLSRETGGAIGAAPGSRAVHPRPDRMRTWARYYAARNGFAPIDALGLGRMVRLRRALREVARALGQCLMGRDDLAELHLAGLRDAGRGGPAPSPLRFEAFAPLDGLAGAVRAALAGRGARGAVIGEGLPPGAVASIRTQLRSLAIEAERAEERWRAASVARGLARLIKGPEADVAVVSARGRAADWMRGRVLVTVAPEGFVVRRIGRIDRARRVLSVATRGTRSALRIALRAGEPAPPPWTTPGARPERPATLSVVILSYNRWAALEKTLLNLGAMDTGGRSRPDVIVVDNASTDGTRERLVARFPDVRMIALDENRGVEGYNVGVESAGGDVVLILDDDSWPDAGVVGAALDLLDRRPEVAAVVLHPRHPGTKRSEWPFAAALEGATSDGWPVMGCGNLVRRSAWRRVGGYESGFFLYRNDTDLAMKLLGAGRRVFFDPAWTVWHESPAAASKSARWFELATRNWIWLARRHGRGWRRYAGALAGWAWAHRLAGMSPRLHWRALRGGLAGVLREPPALPVSVHRTGRAFADLLRLRRGQRTSSSMSRHSPYR